MTTIIEEISARMEINDLMVDYAMAIDTKNIDALDDIFTPDAFYYTACGGIKGNPEEIKSFLKESLELCNNTQYMIDNRSIKLNGDTAEGVTMCHSPMLYKTKDGEDKLLFVRLWYMDKFVRTEKGWRMKERIEKANHQKDFF